MSCVDRIVLNGYYRMGHDPAGFRLWWRRLTDNNHLMRLAGRFSRRVRRYARARQIPVIGCWAGERKHDIAEVPFPAQVMLNGHNYAACQAARAGIRFNKEGNCFTTISDAAGLASIADTLSGESAMGRLSQACEPWIYPACLCFALDLEEQERSGFRYQYPNFQIEYSRNLLFEIGGRMEQVFQALIDRSRSPLDLKTIKTILGYKHRPKYRKRKGRSAEWEIAAGRPAYGLTVFKLHCGRLTLKISTKLRIEAVAHDTAELHCGRALERFPGIVTELRGILERFTKALSCIDQCFISDETPEQFPAPSQAGSREAGGVRRVHAAVDAFRKHSSLVVMLVSRFTMRTSGRARANASSASPQT